MRARPTFFPLGIVATALVALGAAACSEPAGLRVDVHFGDFKSALSLRIAIAADPDGFVSQPAAKAGGATVTTQDLDGNGTLELVTDFLGPFDSGALSFRVATGNQRDLDIHGQALAFSDAALVAGADGTAALPAGGQGTLSLSLAADTSTVISPGMRATDLLTAGADVTIKGPAANPGASGAQASAIAVCHLDTDEFADFVVGVPNLDPGLNIGPTGAVFVVFGDGGATAAVTLSPSDSSQFSFHGAEGGDQLGAAVGCADLNGDGVDDLVVGAPGAGGGAGRVYAVLGRPGLRQTPIELTSTDHLPDATWTTAVANAHLGSALYAANLGLPKKPLVLLAAPGAKKVHLLTALAATAAADLDAAPHTTFSNLTAAALGAGNLHAVGDALDVVVGNPSYLVAGDVTPSGAVYVFGDVSPATPAAYDANATDATGPSTMLVGPTQSGFGAAVLALDTTGRGQDLFVGAPYDGADGQGRVYVYQHDADFFLARQRDYQRSSVKVIDLGIANAHFGAALGATASGSGASASWQLLVGAPDELRGQRAAAGAAYLLGSNQRLDFPIVDVLYGEHAADHLGAAVTGGQVNGDMTGDLVTVAPFATGGDAGSGVVYALFARARP